VRQKESTILNGCTLLLHGATVSHMLSSCTWYYNDGEVGNDLRP
jgi:hypothetical protein